MISKKLLSEVLGEVQEFIPEEHRVRYCKMGEFDDWKEINIYEFMHKCKVWANNLSQKRYQLYSGIEASRLNTSLVEIYSGAIKQHEISAESEPEAVFEACEWILGKLNE